MAANLRAIWKEAQCPACPLKVNLLSPRKYYSDQHVPAGNPGGESSQLWLDRSSDKLTARQSGDRPDPDGEYFFSNTACPFRLIRA